MKNEKGDFSAWSCKEREGYKYDLGENDLRRWYQRDIDQITHSTGFRKLQRKSQLLSEKDPRSRSRLIHTIEVSRIATEISEKLGLSKELTEAICLAHDIGTSPYGYIGNSFLTHKVGENFSHETVGFLILLWLAKKEITQTSLINKVAKKLKNSTTKYKTFSMDSAPFELYISKSEFDDDMGGAGDKYYLHHIAPEILDGVLNHGEKGNPSTLEGQVVKFADNVAYLSQDIEDILTTQIVKTLDFTSFSEDDVLQYEKNVDGVKKIYQMSWEEIDKCGCTSISLKDAFSASRGKRVATFIKRFVEYNKEQIKKDDGLLFEKSSVLEEEIPQLRCDKGLEFIINFIWSYIEQQYCRSIINTSNEIQKVKMEQLWAILHTKEFKKRNSCYQNFLKEIRSNSLFEEYSEEWLVAFFISNLSWQEVDLIIDSYHERNYTFDLDLDLGEQNYANI